MDPVLLLPGDGETISAGDDRYVRIKAAREEIALTESRYEPGESGPGPHVHRAHADGFWVLDGELTFEVGGELSRLGAGGFVLIPPNVVHTFRNEGPAAATFLNVHAPSMGFDQHLRALHGARSDEERREAAERFDTFDPPPDGGRPASDALLRPPGAGETLSLGPSEVVVKAGREHAGGVLSLTEATLGPGAPGPVPHRHETFVDSFYVLDGALTLQLDERSVEATAGTYALVPPGAVHTFSNPAEAPARFLNLMAPGGLEQYLREVAAALPPAGAPDPALMAQIASRYDFVPAV
ncbi:MAG: cupin domain-containing protein [Actinomycetota bacterium]|nr:cupin domain-containing protein [Actinomycetota bacterium]